MVDLIVNYDKPKPNCHQGFFFQPGHRNKIERGGDQPFFFDTWPKKSKPCRQVKLGRRELDSWRLLAEQKIFLSLVVKNRESFKINSPGWINEIWPIWDQ